MQDTEDTTFTSRITVDEFSADVGAMFARVEQGERLEVTRAGELIALLVQPSPRRRCVHEIRLDLRLRPDQLVRIEQAAEVTRESVGAFVLSAAMAEADRVVARADNALPVEQIADKLAAEYGEALKSLGGS